MTRNVKPARIGIIGCGKMGGWLAKNLQTAGGEIVAAQRRTPEKFAVDFAANFPGIRLTGDADDILNDLSIDAVVIAATNSDHYRYAKLAMEKGKHVLVEKPFTETAAQAAELVALARRKKLTLMVDHVLLFSPEAQWLMGQINKKDGKFRGRRIKSIQATRHELHNDNTAHLELPAEIGVHALYLIDSIAQGKDVTVEATSADIHKDSRIKLTFGRGPVAEISLERDHSTQKNRSASVTFAGTGEEADETVQWNELGEPRVSIQKNGELSIPDGIPADSNPLGGVARQFLECIATRQAPLCSGLQGLRTMEMLEGIEQSIRGGKAVKLQLTPYPERSLS